MLLDSSASTPSAGIGATGTLLLLVLGIFLYFLPAAVAYNRKTINAGAVLVINLFIGWTFIGWVVAMAMAAGGMTQEQLQARVVSKPASAPLISPDGRHWWNGREWIALPPALPPEQ